MIRVAIDLPELLGLGGSLDDFAVIVESQQRAKSTMGSTSPDPPRGDLREWRYRPSLDLAPWIDRPTTTTSLDRLDTECGEQLSGLGFAKGDGDAEWWRPSWSTRPWRPVWAGYTPEQRRLIPAKDQARSYPTAVNATQPRGALHQPPVQPLCVSDRRDQAFTRRDQIFATLPIAGLTTLVHYNVYQIVTRASFTFLRLSETLISCCQLFQEHT